MIRILTAGIFLTLAACSAPTSSDPQQIVDLSIKSHGFDQLANKKISFTFRKKNYEVQRSNGKYVYTRTYKDSLGVVSDVLVNSGAISRKINNNLVSLNKKDASIAMEAVNSVLYFFQLPYGLNDQAVNKKHQGTEEMNGITYDLISVTFAQDGGGADFQDEYLYWISQKDHTIDYLAYNYIVNGGGVRFRQAINRRTINGMVFQDYVNFKPDSKKTPLQELSKLFVQGKLKELSRIISEDVKIENI